MEPVVNPRRVTQCPCPPRRFRRKSKPSFLTHVLQIGPCHASHLLQRAFCCSIGLVWSFRWGLTRDLFSFSVSNDLVTDGCNQGKNGRFSVTLNDQSNMIQFPDPWSESSNHIRVFRSLLCAKSGEKVGWGSTWGKQSDDWLFSHICQVPVVSLNDRSTESNMLPHWSQWGASRPRPFTHASHQVAAGRCVNSWRAISSGVGHLGCCIGSVSGASCLTGCGPTSRTSSATGASLSEWLSTSDTDGFVQELTRAVQSDGHTWHAAPLSTRTNNLLVPIQTNKYHKPRMRVSGATAPSDVFSSVSCPRNVTRWPLTTNPVTDKIG